MSPRNLFLTLLSGVMLTCLVAQANIVGTVQDNQNGTYTYSYTIDNTGGFDIFAFSLNFDFPANAVDWNQQDIFAGGGVQVPEGTAPTFEEGWFAEPGVPLVGQSAQDFVALDLFGAGDVLPGNSLAGFSFTSAHPPSQITFFLELGPFGGSAVGTTVGPALSANNSLPTISNIPNLFVNKESTRTEPFQVDDVETPSDLLRVDVHFAGGDLDIFNDIIIEPLGTGNNRNLFINATTQREGSVIIDVEVLDLNGGQAHDTLIVDVGPLANTEPLIAPIRDREVVRGETPDPIDFLFGDTEDRSDDIEIIVSSDNQLVVRDQDILIGAPGNDILLGNPQDDLLLPLGERLPPGGGNDVLLGGPERDFLLGNNVPDDHLGQRQLLFPPLNRPGSANITVTARDPLGFESTRTFSLDVLSGEPLIVDNGGPGFSDDGHWQPSGAAGQFGDDSLFAFEPGAKATFAPDLPQAGTFGVYARWANRIPGGGVFDRDPGALFHIHHQNGMTTSRVDQRQNAGQFILLGVFDFAADGTEKVVLERQNVIGGSTNADAVRFIAMEPGQGLGGPGDLIVDNLDSGFTTVGPWLNSNASDSYAGGSVFNNVPGVSARFTPNIMEDGKYEVYVRWTARRPNGGTYPRDPFAQYTVQHSLGTSETTINQNVRPGQWTFLGAFQFAAGMEGFVDVSRTHTEISQATSADVARFIKMEEAPNVDIIVDNLDAGFTTVGAWLESGTADEYMQSSLVSFNFGDSATWTPELPEPGTYKVFARWSNSLLDGTRFPRDSHAWYEVTHANGSKIVRVDQNFNAGNWMPLGTFDFNADGAEKVQLFHSFLNNLGASADAVRFLKETN